MLGLSSPRYEAWFRADSACELDDRTSCPRVSVQRLTFHETQAIGDIVQAPQDNADRDQTVILHLTALPLVVFVFIPIFDGYVGDDGGNPPAAQLQALQDHLW